MIQPILLCHCLLLAGAKAAKKPNFIIFQPDDMAFYWDDAPITTKQIPTIPTKINFAKKEQSSNVLTPPRPCARRHGTRF